MIAAERDFGPSFFFLFLAKRGRKRGGRNRAVSLARYAFCATLPPLADPFVRILFMTAFQLSPSKGGGVQFRTPQSFLPLRSTWRDLFSSYLSSKRIERRASGDSYKEAKGSVDRRAKPTLILTRHLCIFAPSALRLKAEITKKVEGRREKIIE